MHLKRTIFCLIFVLFFLSILLPAFASVRISPNRFEFTVDPKTNKNIITGVFKVESDGKEEVRFKVYPEFFDITPDYKLKTTFEILPNNSLVDKIRFNPKEFNLIPGSQQLIRFTITDINNLVDGESRVILFLEDTKTKVQALPTNNSKVSASVNIKTRVGIPIYIDKGQYTKTGSIESVLLTKIEDNYFYELKVKSEGNSRIRITGSLQVENDGKLVYETPIESRAIQPGTSTIIRDLIPYDKLTSNDNYKFIFNVSYKDQAQKQQTIVKEINTKLSDIPQSDIKTPFSKENKKLSESGSR